MTAQLRSKDLPSSDPRRAGVSDPSFGSSFTVDLPDGAVCFVIKAELGAPVMTERTIPIDGIVLRMRELVEGEASVGAPFPHLAWSQGTFLASAGFFVSPVATSIVLTQHITVRGLRINGSSDDAGIKRPDGRRRLKYGNNDRRFGTTINPHPTLEGATAVYWQCVGFPEPIMRLLRRVDCIGGRRNAFYGEVLSWDALPCDAGVDPALAGRIGSDGRVLRNLPAALVPRIPVGAQPAIARLEPPYGDPNDRVAVVAPTLPSMFGHHGDAAKLFGF